MEIDLAAQLEHGHSAESYSPERNEGSNSSVLHPIRRMTFSPRGQHAAQGHPMRSDIKWFGLLGAFAGPFVIFHACMLRLPGFRVPVGSYWGTEFISSFLAADSGGIACFTVLVLWMSYGAIAGAVVAVVVHLVKLRHKGTRHIGSERGKRVEEDDGVNGQNLQS
jgi:hypothetical protein